MFEVLDVGCGFYVLELEFLGFGWGFWRPVEAAEALEVWKVLPGGCMGLKAVKIFLEAPETGTFNVRSKYQYGRHT